MEEATIISRAWNISPTMHHQHYTDQKKNIRMEWGLIKTTDKKIDKSEFILYNINKRENYSHIRSNIIKGGIK